MTYATTKCSSSNDTRNAIMLFNVAPSPAVFIKCIDNKWILDPMWWSTVHLQTSINGILYCLIKYHVMIMGCAPQKVTNSPLLYNRARQSFVFLWNYKTNKPHMSQAHVEDIIYNDKVMVNTNLSPAEIPWALCFVIIISVKFSPTTFFPEFPVFPSVSHHTQTLLTF